MGPFPRDWSRRRLLAAGLALWSRPAAGEQGEDLPPEWRRYPDPATDIEVLRLTDPAHRSGLPARPNRIFARAAWMLYWADPGSGPQAYRLDLKTGGIRKLTEAANLDGRSMALSADDRALYYFAGNELRSLNLVNARERTLYTVPDGWERSSPMTVEARGLTGLFAERRGEASRLRTIGLNRATARTEAEAPFVISEAIARPELRGLRPGFLCRCEPGSLGIVAADSKQPRRLPTAPGRIGTAFWNPDGKTVLYLNFPENPRELNAIREVGADGGADRLVARTSQFVDFTCNRDNSVFAGASRNSASPTLLLMLRSTRRELTLCEHKAGHPENVAPRFSPDSQRVYFESDRHGKPAIYSVRLDRLVEPTDGEPE
jgi:oligogalacturonide lyase